MPGKLKDLLEQVSDRESFLEFARALMTDRITDVELEAQSPSNPYGPGRMGWQNGTIEAFLDAAIAWTEDSNGKPMGLPDEPAWKSFAWFLYAGKHYE